MYREKICQFMNKKYCGVFTMKKEKYGDCEDIPPKYTTNGNTLIAYFIYIVNMLF